MSKEKETTSVPPELQRKLATGAAVFALADRTPNSFLIGGLLLWQSSLYLAAPAYSLFYKACTL